MKPTFGTFVDYNPRGLLHCGLTDSLGQVYHFNERGLHKELWNEVIVAPVDSSLSDKDWDSLLVEHNERELNKVRSVPYEELDNNCFDYVSRFMNRLTGSSEQKVDIMLKHLTKPIEYFQSYFNLTQSLQQQPGGSILSGPRNLLMLRHKYNCDGCGKENLLPGDHFSCEDCSEFDLCGKCFHDGVIVGEHKKHHRMKEMT